MLGRIKVAVLPPEKKPLCLNPGTPASLGYPGCAGAAKWRSHFSEIWKNLQSQAESAPAREDVADTLCIINTS